MKLTDRYDLLMRSEVEYAYFNACRTLEIGEKDMPELVESEYGFGLVDRTRPSSPYYNRIVVSAAAKELRVPEPSSSLQAIEVQMPQQTLVISQQLLAAGWCPQDSLCYLQFQPNGLLEVQQPVTKLNETETTVFFDAIGLPLVKRKPSYYCNNRFQCYVAYTQSGEVAAWATMYVGERFGFLGNAETLHEHRNKGFHSAVLAARLNEAMRLGLGVAYTDVMPGTQSHMNCLAAGFSNLAVNQIWGRGVGA